MSKRDPVEFVVKGWGWEKWLVNKPEYCGKILFFAKGKKCSWHFHYEKDETFFLESGRLQVRYTTAGQVEGLQKDLKWNKFEQMTESQKDEFKEATFGVSETVILEPGDCFDVPPRTIHQMTGLLDTYLFEFSTQHFDEDSIRVIKGN